MTFEEHTYLKNDELLKSIHDSLMNGNPVAIEWAAKYENEWTLHFSVVSCLDLSQDNITVFNPYGYIEDIGIEEFLSRTTFDAYENLPLFLNFILGLSFCRRSLPSPSVMYNINHCCPDDSDCDW